MKLGNLLIVATLLIGTAANAQEGEDRECTRMRVIANNAMGYGNYPEAVEYFLRAEKLCPEFGKDNYDRLVSCAIKMVNKTEGDASKAYTDTLLGAWERSEAKGFYDQLDDLNRGYYYLMGTTPNYVKSDFHLKRAIETLGKEMNEQFIPVYYYNVYTLWYMEQDATKKDVLKQRLITDYFSLSKLIQEANFAPKTQENLTLYMRQAIQTCDDILPMMPNFMSSLPEDVEIKKTMMLDMTELLESIGCTDTKEYKELLKTMYKLYPDDREIMIKYLNLLPCSERIPLYREIISTSKDEKEKNDMQYEIARCYYEMGSYTTAFNAAKSVGGDKKGSALSIMGQCVGKTANGCGDSTFERKCNYIYAVQLLEQAQANGASGLSGVISSYKSNYPTTPDIFDNGSPTSVSLTCWGVSVNPNK